MQVVSSGENLQVVSVWNQLLHYLVNLFGFLWLATTLAENYVTVNTAVKQLTQVTLIAYQASFFRMLKIVAVTLCYLSVYCLFDPHKFVNQFVSEFVEKLKSDAVFGVDNPNK